MKVLEEINTTFHEVLDHNPRGAYIYNIMFEGNQSFYIGMTLGDLRARFKTHLAKWHGDKKYPDRPNCQEIVCEIISQTKTYKCTGRQTHGYRQCRQHFESYGINFDIMGAEVILQKFSMDKLDPYGTDLEPDADYPMINKFMMEQEEMTKIDHAIPLANDQTVHLTEKILQKLGRKKVNIG